MSDFGRDPARRWREHRDKLALELEKLRDRTRSDPPTKEVALLIRDLEVSLRHAERKIAWVEQSV